MAAPPQAHTGGRLLFVDNIRWILIALVICHHAAVTYSHVRDWYYLDGPKPPLVTTLLFATFETFDQAYFMGLLFLIAGYFFPRALDKKGFCRFLRDRAVRLGIPALFFMLAIHPFAVYWLLHHFDNPSIPPLTKAYGRFLSSGKVFSASGPMWFAVALLIFCAVYGAIGLLFPRPAKAASLPGHKAIPLWPAILLTSGVLRGDPQRLLGGFHWQSAAFCFWEAFFRVGLCLGFIVVFRDWFNIREHFRNGCLKTALAPISSILRCWWR